MLISRPASETKGEPGEQCSSPPAANFGISLVCMNKYAERRCDRRTEAKSRGAGKEAAFNGRMRVATVPPPTESATKFHFGIAGYCHGRSK